MRTNPEHYRDCCLLSVLRSGHLWSCYAEHIRDSLSFLKGHPLGPTSLWHYITPSQQQFHQSPSVGMSIVLPAPALWAVQTERRKTLLCQYSCTHTTLPAQQRWPGCMNISQSKLTGLCQQNCGAQSWPQTILEVVSKPTENNKINK